MMLESIMRMKKVLVNIREKKVPELYLMIPCDSDFIIYEAILPLLRVIKQQSELLSAEKTPTCQLGIPALVYIRDATGKVKRSALLDDASADVRDGVKAVMTALEEQIDRRFPACGTDNHLRCVGLLLHPYYRGTILKKFIKLYPTIDKMVADHPSTAEFARQSNLDRDLVSGDTEDPMEIAMAEYPREEEEVTTAPLMAEIERYLKMVVPPEKAEVDVLQWWKTNAAQLPLLSEEAR
jgi:hypothetical protein